MKLTGIMSNLRNRAKINKLSRKNAKEVRELYKDLTQNTNYKNVKVDIKNKNSAQLVGVKETGDTMSIALDFEKGTQTQIEKFHSYIFRLTNPIREFTREIRGTIDGDVRNCKTTDLFRNQEGTRFHKITEYQNFKTGNVYRREETPEGVKFFKNIDGDFVELFTKK